MAQATKQNTTELVVHNQTVYDRQTIARIAAMFSTPVILPALKSCPFCMSKPECDGAFHGRAVVYCNNDECPAIPQVTGATIEAAAKLWNHRFHPGFVAPEVRQ